MLVRGNRRARETGFLDRKTDCQTDLRERRWLELTSKGSLSWDNPNPTGTITHFPRQTSGPSPEPAGKASPILHLPSARNSSSIASPGWVGLLCILFDQPAFQTPALSAVVPRLTHARHGWLVGHSMAEGGCLVPWLVGLCAGCCECGCWRMEVWGCKRNTSPSPSASQLASLSHSLPPRQDSVLMTM